MSKSVSILVSMLAVMCAGVSVLTDGGDEEWMGWERNGFGAQAEAEAETDVER